MDELNKKLKAANAKANVCLLACLALAFATTVMFFQVSNAKSAMMQMHETQSKYIGEIENRIEEMDFASAVIAQVVGQQSGKTDSDSEELYDSLKLQRRQMMNEK